MLKESGFDKKSNETVFFKRVCYHRLTDWQCIIAITYPRGQTVSLRGRSGCIHTHSPPPPPPHSQS